MLKKHGLNKKILILFIFVFASFLLLKSDVSLAQPQGSEETNYGQPNILWWEFDLKAKKPALEINIPGLNLSNVVSTSDEKGTYYFIPWIPELISTVYNFSIGIVSIIAVIVIIIQGMRIVTSAGGEGKSAAYKKIGQAVIGLFIAWGSFAILYNINPSTVEFNALKVKTVPPQNLPDFEEMRNTTDETVSPDDANEVVNDTPKFTNCPITLSNPLLPKAASTANKEARTLEFYEKIVSSGVINGGTQSERIMQVADAAAKCGIRFGNCGKSAGTMWTLAGVAAKKYYDPTKLSNPRDTSRSCLQENRGCWPQEDKETKRIFNWPSSVNALSRSQNECETLCKTKNALCSTARIDSTKKVMEALVNSLTEERLEAEINKLQAGDLFWIYNANGSVCRGNHAMIFDKWLSDGRAQVVQGQTQSTQNMSKPYSNGQVVYGAVCIKASCASKFTRKPISRIFRPQ